MITLWGRRSSSNVQKVAWALNELGLPYERRNVGGSFGQTDDPEYRALNPNGLVPTLRDDRLTLWESDAIVRYLAARHGSGTLQPDTPEATALADQWACWNATTYYPALAPLFFGTVRKPRAEQDASTLGAAAEKLAATARILDRALEGRDWIAADRLTFAEIGLGVTTRRAFNLPYGALDRVTLPNLARWFDALAKRPAFCEHVDLPMGTCLEEWTEHEKALA